MRQMDDGFSIKDWGMDGVPPIDGDPFELARSSCLQAVQLARDVSFDEEALERFAGQLDAVTVRDVMKGHMGENCGIVAGDFRGARDAANFALSFGLLQFGHGFRYELHRLCGRGASKTITQGVGALSAGGGLSAVRLRDITTAEIRQVFQLPSDDALNDLVMQLHTVLQQAGTVLQTLCMDDFDAFCRQILKNHEATHHPAAALVRELANRFPAFNDQGLLHNGSRVVLLKKATLAVGELNRLAGPHDPSYVMSQDLYRAIAPVDNVVPAMLVYHGVFRLSPPLYGLIHEQRRPLERGPREAELRALSLVACERIVAAAGYAFTALELGYYLWLSGKAPGARQFARHHTKDTVFY